MANGLVTKSMAKGRKLTPMATSISAYLRKTKEVEKVPCDIKMVTGTLETGLKILDMEKVSSPQ